VFLDDMQGFFNRLGRTDPVALVKKEFPAFLQNGDIIFHHQYVDAWLDQHRLTNPC
jgi:hypothetical protein